MDMYLLTIPHFKKTLSSVAKLLKKTTRQMEQKKIKPEFILKASLAPDMLDFTHQIQLATDFMKNGAGRLAGKDLLIMEDTETSFEELQTRIIRTLAYLDSIKPDHMCGAESREIIFSVEHSLMGTIEFQFKGFEFLQAFVTPNVYFHITTAYAILRHHGIELGKSDFLGTMGQKIKE
ncbi:MAG: hypothetical protein CBC42_01250 [Betaproteobacteria bacterium TMED82]|mgnify:CR=1 FL=1|nr:MAG: hypothetical protein CBC42_01250 [Betaproteobacteria bacterium TMED82]